MCLTGLTAARSGSSSADGFPADDSSVFAVKRSDPERVLFVHQASDSRSPVYFSAALSAATQGAFILQSIDSEKSADVAPSKYAFVVLSDTMALPSIFENASVALRAGRRQCADCNGNVGRAPYPHPYLRRIFFRPHLYTRNGYAGCRPDGSSPHPVMNEAGWADLKVYYAAGVDAAQARVLARLTDQTPLLMEKQIGEGHVLLFASGLDNLTNDLPVHPAFVPFVDRTARFLSGSDNIGGSRLVDSFVPLRTSAAVNPSSGVEIIGPGWPPRSYRSPKLPKRSRSS